VPAFQIATALEATELAVLNRPVVVFQDQVSGVREGIRFLAASSKPRRANARRREQTSSPRVAALAVRAEGSSTPGGVGIPAAATAQIGSAADGSPSVNRQPWDPTRGIVIDGATVVTMDDAHDVIPHRSVLVRDGSICRCLAGAEAAGRNFDW
jgi:hypothetical protein